MPPKATKELRVFVINVGSGTRNIDDFQKLYLDKAKYILKRCIEKKIFLDPKHEIGLVVLGTDVTENDLEFDNIHQVTENIQVPTWTLVKHVTNLQATASSSNWINAIYVALKILDRGFVEKSSLQSLMLLNDFNEGPTVIEQFDVNEVANEIRERDIRFIPIGERDISQNSFSAMNSSEKFVLKLCEKTDSQYLTLDDALEQTSFYRQRPTKPIGWGTTLDFAGFKIPIAKYLKVTNSWKLPTWKKFVKSDYNKEVNVSRVHQYTDRYRDAHTFENIISGYMYGGVFVPYTDTTKTEAEYKSGEKSFIIRNFAKRNEVYLDLWTGSGSYVVVPSGKEAIRPFYSLVQAMVDEDMVAIVRKVYYSNRAPRMGILFPYINVLDQPWCLVFVEMIFAEDKCLLHRMPMNSLVKQLSKEQDEAIDGFIDSMTLPESRCASDSDEIEPTFDAGTVHNPGIQHMWNVLSRRSLNPDSKIPPMESYLSNLVVTPAPLKEKSLPYLKKMEKLFQWKDTYETENKLNDKKETDVKETKDKLQDHSKAGSKNIAENAPEVQEIMDAELSQQFVDDVDLDNLAMNM